MTLTNEEVPTRPFSDPEALQQLHERARKEIDEEIQIRQAQLNTIAAGAETDAEAVTPASTSLAELVRAFHQASLECSPNPRLVIAQARQSQSPLKADYDSALIPLHHTVAGWNMVGVIQRTQDVQFMLSVPFLDTSEDKSPTTLKPKNMILDIYYNPESDNCEIANRSAFHLNLTELGPPETQRPLISRGVDSIHPGMWRITAGETQQHLVDFLVLQRQFVTSSLLPSTKRLASGVELSSNKRQKLHETEFVLVAGENAKPLVRGREIQEINDKPLSVTAQSPVSLLDLSKGASIAVKPLNTKKDFEAANNSSSYELELVQDIEQTPTSRVFACRHSALPGDVVTKAFVYKGEGRAPGALIRCAQMWKREKDMLDGLHHPNIIDLKAFDGRLYAIYLERLPLALHRQFPLRPGDAHIILRDISSALMYLETRGLAHNDIKPANIAYSPERGAVLFDFGMASSSTTRSATGGTWLFFPPEYSRRRIRGAPGDIWALGLTMLYGLGKIKSPPKSRHVKNLNDLIVLESLGYQRYQTWLGVIASVKKSSLSSEDKVENAVSLALDTNPSSRITASGVIKALEG